VKVDCATCQPEETAGVTVRGSPTETVLVLDEELERRVAAAAHLAGIDPREFIVRAIQASVARTLGEPGGGDHLQATGRWAIRPTPTAVLRLVGEAAVLAPGAIVGSQRSFKVARARKVAAYLLRHDAGLTTLETKSGCCMRASCGTPAPESAAISASAGGRRRVMPLWLLLCTRRGRARRRRCRLSHGGRDVCEDPGHFKEHRALRTEITINDPLVFQRTKGLDTLPHLRAIGRRINTKLLDSERVADGALAALPFFDRLQLPTLSPTGPRTMAALRKRNVLTGVLGDNWLRVMDAAKVP
jgi:hypothetical protein